MIPNIFHFIHLESSGGRQFGLPHYLAIKSAHDVNRPDAIYLHCNNEPTGPWWDKARPLITVNRVTPPEHIHGNRLHHPAHQADVIRLQVLREMGGIYLDMDTICVKPLRPFYELRFAIGRQLDVPSLYGLRQKLLRTIKRRTLRPFIPRIHGLCNAAMLAEPGSEFIELWLESYKTFRSKGQDAFWDEHSIRKPLELSRKHSDKITQLSPYSFHFPLWDPAGLHLLFERALSFPSAYVHHVWESKSWGPYLSQLTPELIMSCDTTYNRIARRYL